MMEYRIFLPYLIPRNNPRVQFYFLIMLLYLAAERAFNVLIPRQMGIVADKLAQSEGTGTAPLKEVSVWLLLKWLDGNNGIYLINQVALRRFQSYSKIRVATAALDHTLNMSMDFHDDADSAEIMAAVRQGDALTTLLDTFVFTLLPTLVDLFIAFAYFTHLFDICE